MIGEGERSIMAAAEHSVITFGRSSYRCSGENRFSGYQFTRFSTKLDGVSNYAAIFSHPFFLLSEKTDLCCLSTFPIQREQGSKTQQVTLAITVKPV